jgi:hypothetical protein
MRNWEISEWPHDAKVPVYVAILALARATVQQKGRVVGFIPARGAGIQAPPPRFRLPKPSLPGRRIRKSGMRNTLKSSIEPSLSVPSGVLGGEQMMRD